jgi:hypothetical protein
MLILLLLPVRMTMTLAHREKKRLSMGMSLSAGKIAMKRLANTGKTGIMRGDSSGRGFQGAV